MFDYQAGEKYKLTLIMVALAGVMAGVFFTVLLMPTPEAAPKRRQPPAWASNPDATGQAQMPTDYNAQAGPGDQQAGQGAAPLLADPMEARNLVENFLPLAWDLSAYSSRAHQDQAQMLMTEDCRQAYTSKIWTPQIAHQIEQSGVQSSFVPKRIEPSPYKADGSVEVTVEGEQTLAVPGKGKKERLIKVVYLVKHLPEGLRIAGISETQ